MGDTVCANIGPNQRRRRLMLGVAALVAGVVWVRFAWSAEYPPYTRLAAFVFFHGGFVGIFQARAQTCVRLASMGLRNLDSGTERIEDDVELAAVRAQARKVIAQSLLAAAVVSAATLLLP